MISHHEGEGVPHARTNVAGGRRRTAVARAFRWECAAMADLSLATTVAEFYWNWYQPEKHPGPAKKTTRGSCVNDLLILNRVFQFRQWLARFNAPPRPRVSLGDLYRDFMWWRDHCEEPTEQVTLGELTDDLEVFAMNLFVERRRANATANRFWRHVNAIRNHVARKLKTTPPDVTKYPELLKEPIALLPDELAEVMLACQRMPGVIGRDKIPAGEWYLAAFMFIYSLGARISACRGVRTSSLDLDRGTVMVPAEVQKQGKDQPLDLFPSVVKLLRDLRLAERGVPTVLGDFTGDTDTLRDRYKQILVDAGLYRSVDEIPSEGLLHQLRKTLASQIFQSHGIHAACDRLGHSSIAVTLRYIDSRYKSQPRLVDMVADPLGGPTPPTTPALRVYRGEAG